MNPFQSLRDYEEFVYTLQQQFPLIRQSTLVVVRRGQRVAILQGEIMFDQGYRLSAKERLAFDEDALSIEDYGYELWHNGDKLAWYDSQPHPNDPTLASTHPHHKHVPPDIKRHRLPAPNMSFTQPNLPALIQEVETLLAESK
jgi:hypothetical protein